MSRDPTLPLPPLLELAAGQLEVALQSASSQVERLSNSVAAFARLGTEMSAHPDANIAALGARVSAEAQRAMFAMQFEDQLAQRLQHIAHALGDMHDALAAPTPPTAAALLAAIRARYTMEDERRLFDIMLGHLHGAPDANADSDHEATRGSVELF
ncbi:MAG TPA: hypothetical protein VFL16_07055 [Steroidobacteraceae bacterium]|jgi:hypothetical protein|nr:hypothetical protein [Steroidobacteraceae bacterium]